MKVPYSWLKDYVDITLEPKELAERLTMAGLEVVSIEEKLGDQVFEIEVTSNRPDWLSIIGVAREVAAICGRKLKMQNALACQAQPGQAKCKTQEKSGKDLPLSIKIEDKEGCLRYVGRVINDVKVASSPEWMQKRLEACGIRPVNNVVDITNYVLLEYGQPLHAFDYAKLAGGRIVVRRAVKDEEITAIDGRRIKLDSDVLVIADEKKPVALAGIMGGLESEVTGTTKDVLLESAYFDPVITRRSSKKLGTGTDSSYRFERGVDFEGVLTASERAAELIVEICGGVASSKVVDCKEVVPKSKKVFLAPKKANDVLGLRIPEEKQKAILKSLGFTVKKSKGGFDVTAPSFRRDVSLDVDLIEEIARVFGYDKIPVEIAATLNERPVRHKEIEGSKDKIVEDLVKDTLVGLGLNEIITYSLINPKILNNLGLAAEGLIELQNPLSEEQKAMRLSIVPSVLSIISRNINRKNLNLKLFELGRVYYREAEAEREDVHLYIALTGLKCDDWQRKKTNFTFFDMKGILEELFKQLGMEGVSFKEESSTLFSEAQSAAVYRNDEAIGYIGSVKKEVLHEFDIEHEVILAEIEFGALAKHSNLKRCFRGLPKYPSINRDISIVVPVGAASASATSIIKEKGGDLVKNVRLFDTYTGSQIPAGFKGLSFSIEYRDDSRTLVDEEVDAVHSNIKSAIIEALGAKIR